MLRNPLMAITLTLLCSTASAQQQAGRAPALATPARVNTTGAAGAPQACAVQHCFQTLATHQPSIPSCYPDLSVCDLTQATGSWSLTNIPRSETLASGGVTQGIFIYTTTPGVSTFQFDGSSGFLCLSGFKRSSKVNPPTICGPGGVVLAGHPNWNSFTGDCATTVHSIDVNCSAGAMGIMVGDDVNVQAWIRDPVMPLEPDRALLSNAVFYTVQ